MRGFVALRENVSSPHLYLLVPDAGLRPYAISTALATKLSAEKQETPGAFLFGVFAELVELLGAYELYTYQNRLICDPGAEMEDAYPLLDFSRCSVSWYQLSTTTCSTRLSFEASASLAA